MSKAREKNIEMIRGILDINPGVDVYSEVKQAIGGQLTTVDEVLEKMMDENDKKDLKNGKIPFECLQKHVEVWCAMGKPDQNS